MRQISMYAIFSLLAFLTSHSVLAQSSVVKAINDYGTFDRWCVREVEESALIGGNTEYLYEFYGSPYDTLRVGKTPFTAPEGYLWRTNNVLAVILGIVKTNNTVYPEKRGNGYCARIETHLEEVKVLGMVNMDVCCQGAMMIGELPEPIRDTKDPMTKVLYGVPFNGRPKCLRLDYKADVGHEVYRGTGFSRLKAMGYPDYAEITVMLIKKWEDESGNVHSLRVGTGIERITEDIPEWVNGHEVEIHYGDITDRPFYRDYMGLKTDPVTAYRAMNSRGEKVIIQEEGWAEPGTEPNWLMIHFITSCGEAFYGGLGNTLWIDNVYLEM